MLVYGIFLLSFSYNSHGALYPLKSEIHVRR